MLYINGEWKNAYSNETMDVINPATGEVIAQVASGGSRETKEAIAAADAAFQEWKNTTAFDRAQYMKKVSELMRERAEDLAKTITMEMGKPINEARREVNSAINYNDWFLEEAKRVYGETVPASHQDKHLMVLREPVGVTAAITPWNFPLSMITRKISPAIAAGCTVIIKPAPATPLSAIKLFECFHGGPAKEIGSELTKSPIVRKLTFTGSTAVGKKLLRDSADTVKKVSMELGGHAPFIVFRDADLDLAVNSAVMTKFVNNGQTCICTNRIYVEESIAKEFGEKFAAKAKALRVGNGLNEEVQVGPLISEQSLNKVESHVQDALSHNGKLLCGGKRYESEGLNGYFYEPTVINYANEEMKIATEETFGPVAPIFSFSSEEEVIEKANQTNYGLAAYCFTKDLGKAFRMMKALEYGIVGINDPAPIVVQAPFGGYKESGIGREGGRSGILEYVEEKFVSIGGL